ncbi:DUF1223 domain-containing protein [Aquicoccus sp. G2-2]|uniref:DUF1223 domain-containing protein n=1 Tax=Aquicoccus sp. G2-2 TaxID=3092120 RepID=UPI002ADEFF09|nr:DUF1223 domain-containing protein [Aquicoccus sp. G2-2]MEA1113478.1 DUF1223 domain-containing protein [Aquicoccus sp. G2-2]
MRIVWAIGAMVWLALAGGVVAQERSAVVVELYTSQGCSSCPPADALLQKLAQRNDVIALGLHVDYWDYIGWKDVFADHRFTLRQHGYAQAANRRTVYTPQMIIQGQAQVLGNHPKDVAMVIATYQDNPVQVRLRLNREGGRLRIAGDGQAKGPLVVQMVTYEPEAITAITRGENAGRTLSYTNVVRDWRIVGKWDGKGPFSMSAKAPANMPLAVIVQRAGFGRIVAAAQTK